MESRLNMNIGLFILRMDYWINKRNHFSVNEFISLLATLPLFYIAQSVNSDDRRARSLQCRRILGGRKLVNRIATMKPPSLILWQRKIGESSNINPDGALTVGVRAKKEEGGGGGEEKNTASWHGRFWIFSMLDWLCPACREYVCCS